MIPSPLTKTGDLTNDCTLAYSRLVVDTGRTSNNNIASKHKYFQQFRSAKTSSRVRRGWRNPNDYDRTIRKFSPPTGSCQVTTFWPNRPDLPRYVDTYTGEMAIGSSYAPLDLSKVFASNGILRFNMNDIYRTHTEALVKLKDAKVNYGETLAEANKTLNHLATTTRTLFTAYRHARRGKWKQMLSVLKVDRRRRFSSSREAAARWLELSFAWTPLISDIKGTFELLQSKLRDENMIYSVTRQVTTTLSESDVFIRSPRGGNALLGSGRRITKTKLYYKIKNENLAFATSLGLTDPLQVAWALVPFSFMVDWCLPIGTLFEALGAPKGLDFVSGTDVTTLFFKGTYWCQPVRETELNIIHGGFTSQVELFGTKRDVLTRFPPPMLYYKSPFSTSHTISALAVMRSLM